MCVERRAHWQYAAHEPLSWCRMCSSPHWLLWLVQKRWCELLLLLVRVLLLVRCCLVLCYCLLACCCLLECYWLLVCYCLLLCCCLLLLAVLQ